MERGEFEPHVFTFREHCVNASGAFNLSKSKKIKKTFVEFREMASKLLAYSMKTLDTVFFLEKKEKPLAYFKRGSINGKELEPR